MLDLMLVGPVEGAASPVFNATAAEMVRGGDVLARVRRPAILRYRSRLLENARKAAVMPLYLIGWKEEAELLEVNMMEKVRFQRGKGQVPKSVVVTVESMERMQFYWMKAKFTARFRGLRSVNSDSLQSRVSLC